MRQIPRPLVGQSVETQVPPTNLVTEFQNLVGAEDLGLGSHRRAIETQKW